MKDFKFVRRNYLVFLANYEGFASSNGKYNASEGFDKDNDKDFVDDGDAK